MINFDNPQLKQRPFVIIQRPRAALWVLKGDSQSALRSSSIRQVLVWIKGTRKSVGVKIMTSCCYAQLDFSDIFFDNFTALSSLINVVVNITASKVIYACISQDCFPIH